MPPHLIREQRRCVFAHVIEGLRVIRPDQIRFNVFQHFRIPVTALQIAKTHAILPTREIIFGQRHDGVIRRYRQSPQRIKLTVGRALVTIQQGVPFIPLFTEGRLTLINGIFAPRFINMPVAITILHIGGGSILRRDTVDNLFQDAILQCLLRGHNLAAIRIFLLQIIQHFWLRAGVISQPVIIINAGIAMIRHGVGNTRSFW